MVYRILEADSVALLEDIVTKMLHKYGGVRLVGGVAVKATGEGLRPVVFYQAVTYDE